MPINGTTKVLGIIGYPIIHTLSPVMHNKAFEVLNYNAVYVPFEVEPNRLKEAISGIKAMGIRGVNITIPHKESVMEYLDEIDPLARSIKAVNTIVNEEGILTGYNTDGIGFLRSLQVEGISLDHKKVMILGSGGAARAIATCSLKNTKLSELSVVGRTTENIVNLTKDLETIFDPERIFSYKFGSKELSEAMTEIDVVINCTPLGLSPKVSQSPLSQEEVNLLNDNTIIADTIYNPSVTQLMHYGNKRGLKTIGGLGMLLYQGIASFELWTGLKPPEEAMQQALMNAMNKKII